MFIACGGCDKKVINLIIFPQNIKHVTEVLNILYSNITNLKIQVYFLYIEYISKN